MHALPALLRVLEANRHGETTLLLPGAHLPLVAALGGRSVARPAGAGWCWARHALRGEYDVALTARHSTRAKLLLAGARSRLRLASAGRGTAWLGLHRFGVRRSLHQRHDLDAALETLGLPPVGDEPALLPLAPTVRSAGAGHRRQLAGRSRVAVLCPGSRHHTGKRYPAGRFAEVGTVLARAGWTLLVAGGPGEEELLGVVAEGCGGRVVPSGLELDRLAALIAACDATVGNDSGLTHLAAVVGCPTVALHGPTDPRRTGASGRVCTLVEPGPRGLAGLCPHRVAWAAQVVAAGEGLHVGRAEAMIPFGGGPLAQLAEQGTLNP